MAAMTAAGLGAFVQNWSGNAIYMSPNMAVYNITSVYFGAGDWDITAEIQIGTQGFVASSYLNYTAALSPTSGALPSVYPAAASGGTIVVSDGKATQATLGPWRWQGPATVYLVMQCAPMGGVAAPSYGVAYGRVQARRWG